MRSRMEMSLLPRGNDTLFQIFLDMDEVDHIKGCECSRCNKQESVGDEK